MWLLLGLWRTLSVRHLKEHPAGQHQQVDSEMASKAKKGKTIKISVCLFTLFPSFTFTHTLPVHRAPSFSLWGIACCCFWVMCAWWRTLGDDRWMWQADGFACHLFNHTNSVGHEVRALSCQSNAKWGQICPAYPRLWQVEKEWSICGGKKGTKRKLNVNSGSLCVHQLWY